MAKTKKTIRTMYDVKTAVMLYGRILEFDKMEEAARLYFEYDPDTGDLLLQKCEELRDFYKKKRR